MEVLHFHCQETNLSRLSHCMSCRHAGNNYLGAKFEYCVGGDLQALLQADLELPEDSIQEFGRDIARALQYLHSQGFLHCNLKPTNILLNEHGRAKVAGFGLSQSLETINTEKDTSLLVRPDFNAK